MPTLNNDLLMDVIAEILRQSHYHNSFDLILKFIVSGREPLNAFADFLKLSTSIHTINDSPSRVDITFKDEKHCLSILNRNGNFGLRVIEIALRYAKTLVCDRMPAWMRPAFRQAAQSNRLNLLEIMTTQNSSITQLHQIASKVKRLADHTGNFIGNKTKGSYDFIYINKTNLNWTKQFFSEMKFEVKVLKIEIQDNSYGFMQMESGFKSATWASNPKINAIEKVIVLFTLHRSNKPVIQDLINTFAKSFPNMKTLIFEISYNFVHSVQLEKQLHGLPKQFTRVFEAFENTEVPEQLDTVKLNFETHCTERIYTREIECPSRLMKALDSYEIITEEKRVCQWEKNFKYGSKKSARMLLNVYLRRSPFAI